MRAAAVILGLAVAASLHCRAQVPEVEKSLASALRWYYRWIEPIPQGLAAIDCSVALFEELSFAYCKPGPLSIDIETEERQPPRVASIVREHWSFEKSLADFRAHRGREGQPSAAVQRIKIPTRNIGTCKVDWKQTAQASAIALRNQQQANLQSEGLTLRFPLICQGDPFYLVYHMRDVKVEFIWQYRIYPDRLELTWSYDSGTQQRRLPVLAVDNLRDGTLWYWIKGVGLN